MTSNDVPRGLREKLVEAARQLRKSPTRAEKRLWQELRKRRLAGFRFRRQHIIQSRIVDFYCPEARLVIEVDGPIHGLQRDYDLWRDEFLWEKGYKVLRFSNEEIFSDINKVKAEILRSLVDGEIA